LKKILVNIKITVFGLNGLWNESIVASNSACKFFRSESATNVVIAAVVAEIAWVKALGEAL
jgi:hypothetical protein